jgi:hypothetical protein
MQEVITLSQRYSGARARRDEIKAMLDEANDALQQVETELINAMVNAELQNFKRDDGTQFVVVTKQYPAAIPETKQDLYEVLRQQGYSDLFTINSQTLGSQIRQWREEAEYNPQTSELLAQIDPYIRTEERLGISMRRGKK